MDQMDINIILAIFGATFFSSAIRLATPLISAAIGEVFCEKAGILNVGIEGMMLNGAFVAIVATSITDNPWIGVFAAILTSALFALIHAFASIKIQINQVVSGLAINLFVLGATSTINRIYFLGERPSVPDFSPIAIPYLSDIPIIGPIFFNHFMLVYIILFIVLISHFVLFRTVLGMKIRAVGENPRAADTAGINVALIRYGCTIFAGIMAGLAGSFLSLAQMNVFTDNMTAGKGWIALVIVVFGKWTPKGIVVGSLLFGAIEAFSLRAQAYGITVPYELLLLLPYLITILVFAGFIGRAVGPAAMSQPYSKYQQS
jgi:ABC-type uncharacterized transport system permease subunit